MLANTRVEQSKKADAWPCVLKRQDEKKKMRERKHSQQARMAGPRCALSGCNKPRWPPLDGFSIPPLTCGNLHHLLLMASRFDTARPSPYFAILQRNADGLCALPSCEKPPDLDHPWCSKSHYLLWLSEFTASLHPHQICRLPGCTRHVFVDENSRPWQFCGWEHEQKFVMLNALNQQQTKKALLATDAHPSSPAPSIESEYCGLVHSLTSYLDALKQFALHGRAPPSNIKVMEDFYNKHPWEILRAEGHDGVFIARLQFTRKGRKLTTKGHYHWKQSGPRAKQSKNYTVKYYTYMKGKGKQKADDEQHAESSYNMKEYTMEGVSYSLVRLSKEKPFSRTKLPKEQTTQQLQQVVEIDTVCSQDLWHQEIDVCNIDDLLPAVDSIYGELSPLSDVDSIYGELSPLSDNF